MGEAKRRGGSLERVQEARRRKEENRLVMERKVNVQVDEELFLFCSNLYSAAAQMTMPVENPENKRLMIDEYGEIAFRDTPMNRGMLAATKECREHGLSEDERFAMGMRVMHFGNVLEARERFAHWIKAGETSDSLNVGENLIRACAKARFVFTNTEMGFDLDDIERHAGEIEKRLAAEDQKMQAATPVQPQ
jgi:hypothetical protein